MSHPKGRSVYDDVPINGEPSEFRGFDEDADSEDLPEMSESCAAGNCDGCKDVDANCCECLCHLALRAKPTEELYYIQDTRTYCGNSVMWWCVDGRGYTSNLKEAWKVPATWRGRETDKLWLCSAVDALSTLQFDMQKFREIPHSWVAAQ